MNTRTLLAGVLILLSGGATLSAQTGFSPNEGGRITQNSAVGSYTFSWWGQAGRTYFLQQSGDLQNWSYVPIIEPGADQMIGWGFTSSSSPFFLRLKFSDVPTSNPFTADFDGDGVSNYDELLHRTDPLSWADTDSNGLPDDWEQFYFSHLGVDPSAAAARGDGLTNLQAFQQRLNPNDFYNGQTPMLTIESGDEQTGSPNGFITLPLVVLVAGADQTPYINASVTFTVGQGDGLLKKSSSSTPGGSVTVQTNNQGQAEVFFRLPNATNHASHVTVTLVASANNVPPKIFTAMSDGGGGIYNSPFAPTNFVSLANPDGSLEMSWENHTDDQTQVEVEIRQADGTWKLVAVLPPGTTSYHCPGYQGQ